jgi:hypothetical protein
MNPNDPDYLKKARWIWFIVLTVVLWAIIIHVANEPGAGIGAQIISVPRLIISIIASYFASKYIAPIQLKIHEDMDDSAARAKRRAAQKQAEVTRQKMIQEFDKESQTQHNESWESKSRHAIVSHLASIDEYVRVLAAESDPDNRTMAMQKAHSEMMILSAKLVSGDISRATLDVQEIRELAWETCNDLAAIGLSEDRLSRDIKRMFKLDAG